MRRRLRQERGEQAEERDAPRCGASSTRGGCIPVCRCRRGYRGRGGTLAGWKRRKTLGILPGSSLVSSWRFDRSLDRPGEAPGGIIADVIVGIVGAVIGGWLYGLLGSRRRHRFQPSQHGLRLDRRDRLAVAAARDRGQARGLKGAALARGKLKPYGLHHHRAVHRNQGQIVRGRLPGGLHSRQGRRRDALHRSGSVHRLRGCVRPVRSRRSSPIPTCPRSGRTTPKSTPNISRR